MYLIRDRTLELLTLFTGDYKQQLYLREISVLARIPLKTTQSILAKLEKSNILRSALRGKNKYFWLNLDSAQAKLLLLQAEINKTNLFLGKYHQIQMFFKSIPANDVLIVFGSFAKLAADETSDIDLLVISGKDSKFPLHLIPYKVHQIRLSIKSFLKALDAEETLIKEIIENHAILNNHSFYVNALWSHYGKKTD